MRRSTSSTGSKPPLNERNLIFDEWITSTAHPVLAAHSLIPKELVDDEKAVEDMLAEAMSEETFNSALVKQQQQQQEEEEEEEEDGGNVDRPSTPMSAIDIPLKRVEGETRPRSSSSLSLRKWGIFIGRGESARRPLSPATAAPPGPNLTHKRSFSAPDVASTNAAEESDALKGMPTLTNF